LKEKKKKSNAGAKTKYSLALTKKIANYQTHSTIKESYEKYGISKQTYYNWMLEHKEFFDLSTQARKINAIELYSQSIDLLHELKEKRNNPEAKDLVPAYRLLYDGFLRSAGKANQNLFGDKIQVDDERKDDPVNVSITLNEEK